MAASPPRTSFERRRRPRRGSIERPASGRIYRAAWALVALPLLLAAFTVGRPDPLPKPPLPPSFDGATAAQLARELSRLFPDRSPGSARARDAAGWVAERLAAYNLNVEAQSFPANVPGLGTVRLTNVVATPFRIGPERSPGTILVLSHRDNLGISAGVNDNASGTAALIELARNLSTLTVSHTIVFASTDGGAYGGLGAAALAARPEYRERILAVVNLDSLAGPNEPRLEFAGDRPRSPAGVLLATAEASVLEQAELEASFPSPFSQLLDLAFPFSLYEQSPFLGRGISAATLTSAGDRPPSPESDTTINAETLGALGRSAQALITSLDAAAEVARGTDSFVYLGARFVRGGAIQLVLLVMLLPVLLTTIDLFARLRRRGIALGPALRSFRSRLFVWFWAGGIAVLFTAVGLFPNGAPRPISPSTEPAQHWPLAAIAGLVTLSALGWFVARARLIPHEPVDRTDELAGHLVAMLALCVIALVLAVTNAFSLIFVLPSLHAWLWAPHVRTSRLATRIALYAAGFAGPLLLLISFAIRFKLGFDAPWYIATLFTVGYASLTLFLTFLAWAAVAGQIGAVLFGRYAPYPGEPERASAREAVRRLRRRAPRGGSDDALRAVE
jgi:hypothetical protein